MKRRNVLTTTVMTLIFLAFTALTFQIIEASAASDNRQERPEVTIENESVSFANDHPKIPFEVTTSHLLQSPNYPQNGDVTGKISQAPTVPVVNLQAASGASILFVEQNGRALKGVSPETTHLPYLVLYRNGRLTEVIERTLVVQISSFDVPPSGVIVSLEVKTQRGNPDLGPYHGDSITVWRESQHVQSATGISQENGMAVFTHLFADWAPISGTEKIATPTDYFGYEITITDEDHPSTNPLYVSSQEYAFLMESQWVVRLPEVKEVVRGAAPQELIIFYCDMVPFRRSIHDLSSWLPRSLATDYIRTELAPAMIDAFRLQTDTWNFPWYTEWTNPRSGDDSKRLDVALTDGQAWYHGPAPALANSQISIRITARELAHYDTLTDGIMGAFHHELFHNLQQNISQHQLGSGDLQGKDGNWLLFTEGTAMLATAVAQSTVQFAETTDSRAYISRANEFLGEGEGLGDLNTSYTELLPYRAVLYWRFLYEQCGGMQNGAEDPAVGLQIIKNTLSTLLSENGIDWTASTDLVKNVPVMMDHVFAHTDNSCPFHNYEDSLLHFARAIYALRVQGGRCTRPGYPIGCSLYDPNNLYAMPLASQMTYAGEATTLGGTEGNLEAGIGSSFGIDFIEVALRPEANGKPLMLQFRAAPESSARFKVQLLKLTDLGDEMALPYLQTQATVPEILASGKSGGPMTYYIPEVNTAEFDKLALIITRLDVNEDQDPVGAFRVALSPN